MGSDVDTSTERVHERASWLIGDERPSLRAAGYTLNALAAERDEARAEVDALRSVVDRLLADSEIVERDSVGPGVGQQRRTWEAKDRIRAIRKAWRIAGVEAPAPVTDGGA